MPQNSYTKPLTKEQAAKLRLLLQERGWKFEEKEYTLFAARKDKVTVAVYEKGPKILVQGRGLEEFVEFILEPEILGSAEMGYEEIQGRFFWPTGHCRGVCGPTHRSPPYGRRSPGQQGYLL
jgi:ribonuclease HIII